MFAGHVKSETWSLLTNLFSNWIFLSFFSFFFFFFGGEEELCSGMNLSFNIKFSLFCLSDSSRTKYWLYSIIGNQETEKWNISCLISKQRMPQSSAIVNFQCEPVSPEETQEREEYQPSSSHQILSTVIPEKLRMWKHRILCFQTLILCPR